MRYILFLIVYLILVTGCANKIPTPNDEDKGIVAIPVHFFPDSYGQYAYSYRLIGRLNGSKEIQATIPIYSGSGDFVFSDALPSGYYNFDRIVLKGRAQMGYELSNKQAKYTIPQKLGIFVNKGELSMLNYRFDVKRFIEPPSEVYTKFGFSYLTEPELEIYLDKLSKTEQTIHWKIKER